MKNWLNRIGKGMKQCMKLNVLNLMAVERNEMSRAIYIKFYEQLVEVEPCNQNETALHLVCVLLWLGAIWLLIFLSMCWRLVV